MSLPKPDEAGSMVIMGRIAAAHGIRGLVKIQPFTEYLDSLLDYRTWWIGHEQGSWREVEVGQCEVHSKTLVAQLPDCPDRTAAEKLKGLLIAVPRSSLPEQDEGEGPRRSDGQRVARQLVGPAERHGEQLAQDDVDRDPRGGGQHPAAAGPDRDQRDPV
ncbi:MAG: ribosome maturation factor RimM, partial [Gallionella sp.]|nr:ribosome maturation factor RimM [Gallionella sp.]